MTDNIIPGLYRHYKGQNYEVLGVVLHTETNEPMVYYRAAYEIAEFDPVFGQELQFVRPYEMFAGTVEVDGEAVPRFERI